jgi:hypothetical protein
MARRAAAVPPPPPHRGPSPPGHARRLRHHRLHHPRPQPLRLRHLRAPAAAARRPTAKLRLTDGASVNYNSHASPHPARHRRLQPRRVAGRSRVGRRGGGPRHRRLRVLDHRRVAQGLVPAVAVAPHPSVAVLW